MGKAIGTISDIDGTIQTVGVDCGSQGLKQIPFEQLVIQTEVVIFIPKWRLDSQRLLREKSLTLRRLKAMIDIVSEVDDMKQDAKIIHEKYKAKLISLEETQQEIDTKLQSRLEELDEQMKSVKMLIFDAKIQFKSNEIPESTFMSVKTQTTDLIERITHEIAEISNVQKRISDLDVEVKEAMVLSSTPDLHESATSYLKPDIEIDSRLPKAPTQDPVPIVPAEIAVEHESGHQSIVDPSEDPTPIN
jgi:hypothetical protein